MRHLSTRAQEAAAAAPTCRPLPHGLPWPSFLCVCFACLGLPGLAGGLLIRPGIQTHMAAVNWNTSAHNATDVVRCVNSVYRWKNVTWSSAMNDIPAAVMVVSGWGMRGL